MISVVIPTRNRGELLAAAIQSLQKQTLDKEVFEILIVDNGSTDNTAEVVKSFSHQLSNLRYIYAPKPGLHVGRHQGMHEAKGDILVYADDDIEATPVWLESYHQLFTDPKVTMAGGNNYPLFIKTPPDWLIKLWRRPLLHSGRSLSALSILDLKDNIREFSPYMVWGCNFAIRKVNLLDAGGFHPDGMPEDLIRFRGDGETHVSDYIAVSGLKCMFHPGASVYHKVTPERMTHSYFRQRGYNQGISDSYTALRKQKVINSEIFQYKLSHVMSGFFQKLKDQVVLSKEARQALNELKKGYLEGYTYHQNCYAADPEVRAWVHQSNYF